MKKVLFVCNVEAHILSFHIPYIKWLKEHGCEVHVLTKGDGRTIPYCDVFYDIDIYRSPFNLKNIRAIKEAKDIIKKEQYDLVHCHTPMGGVVGRLAAALSKVPNVKIMYTAHGFYFYNGSPKLYWMLYYPVEKILSHLTDCLITINADDYLLAKQRFSSSKTSVEKIDGIGVDIKRFSAVSIEEKEELKKKYGYVGKYVLIYAAEFIERKNHIFLIEHMRELVQECPNVKLIFAGKGKLFSKMQSIAKEMGVDDYIDFLGYRNDMPLLYQMSDILVSPSIEEGYGINVVEGLASGLPAIVSDGRGHREMVINDVDGQLFDLLNPNSFIQSVKKMYDDQELYRRYSQNAIETSRNCSVEHSLNQMQELYKLYI